MPDLVTLRSELLERAAGVRHAFFTRQGGISEGVYRSLNVGRGSKDDPAAVEENRRRVAAHLDLRPDRLVSAYQVHSATALAVEGPWPGAAPEGDALVTDRPELGLGALSADCAPVLMAAPGSGLAAAVHAGWRGALAGVVDAALDQMIARGARAQDVVAAIGPCIGPASYEVGLEFVAQFLAEAASNAAYFKAGATPDKRLFDLPGYVLGRLRRRGVEQAHWIGADTLADPDLFFSNRRAVLSGEPDYGRLSSVIVLTG